MSTLAPMFSLDDFEETRTVWEPIYGDPITHACRDCGKRTSFDQGGGIPGVGGFTVCDGCAQIDQCRLQVCTPVIERRKAASYFVVPELAHCNDCYWFVLEPSTISGETITADDLIDMCAEHARPRHVSHWGESHLVEAHDGLVRKQAQRRAKYLAERAA
ncbi:hypothetical protein GCM10022239_03730 [Leifsonia bigeumensis]|uniref:Uncharacterized protein n=1 Tax=Leifsonella bigeumensis TaxID=433643 RepID=A0ABP7F4Y2_9MICO